MTENTDVFIHFNPLISRILTIGLQETKPIEDDSKEEMKILADKFIGYNQFDKARELAEIATNPIFKLDIAKKVIDAHEKNGRVAEADELKNYFKKDTELALSKMLAEMKSVFSTED